MSKFGLLDDEEPAATGYSTSIGDKLASFPPVRSRVLTDIAAIDAAAAAHGFVSRESMETSGGRTSGRRRRALPSEPSRHLAIRLSESAYDRFVAYADRHKLTYHEALVRLMEGGAGGA